MPEKCRRESSTFVSTFYIGERFFALHQLGFSTKDYVSTSFPIAHLVFEVGSGLLPGVGSSGISVNRQDINFLEQVEASAYVCR